MLSKEAERVRMMRGKGDDGKREGRPKGYSEEGVKGEGKGSYENK